MSPPFESLEEDEVKSSTIQAVGGESKDLHPVIE